MNDGWRLIEHSPDCVKLIDSDGRVLAMNENGRCLMEIDDLSAVCGKEWKSFWPQDTHPLIDAAVAAATAGETGSFQAACSTAKGTLKWWDVLVTRMPESGEPASTLLVISRDITAAREAERKLQASEARFRSLALATSALVWTCAAGGGFDSEQPQWAAFTGQAFDDYRGAGWLEAVHPDDRDATLDAWKEAADARQVLRVSHRLRRADGAYRHMNVRCVPVVDGAGDLVEWIGAHVDVTDEVRGKTEREQLLEQMRAERERVLLATEAAQMGFWSWRPIDDLVHWDSARCYEVFGLPASAEPITASRFVAEFLHPEDAAQFERSVADTLDRRAPFSFEGRVFRADGELRWVEFFGHIREHSEGEPVQIVGMLRDVTERKLVDMELYSSRERFEKIVNQAASGVVLMDTRGTINFVNQKYAEMLGYRPEELTGRSVAEVTSADSLQKTLETVATVLETGHDAVIEKHYVRKDGSLMPATSGVNVLRTPDGANQGVVAIVLDRSEYQRAEAALRASEERYRTLFESMDQGFCIIEMLFDEDGRAFDYRFLEMNRMFEHHSTLTGAAGKTALEMVPNLDRFWIDTYARVARTGEAVRVENKITVMGRWFDVYATPLGAAGGTRVALLFSDITERKHADEKLRRLASDLAEADRRKTEFLATLAHELRNPLAPISSALAVLRLSGDDPATVGRVRAIMERQVGQMVRLIDDLLDVARINRGKLELKRTHADLRQVLSTAGETSLPVIEASRHELQVELPDEVMVADIDVTRIAQVVSNLLNNAAKYTPAGGRIRLSMRRDGNDAQLTVTDNGVGIAAEAIEHVFDMFSQVGAHVDRAQGGLGIGLSLVRTVVDLHGGSVTAASAGAGKGSTFSVRLPLLDAPAALAPDPAQVCSGEGLKLLVADDNVDAALTLSMMLELHGHTVQVAHDGIQALEAAKTFQPHVAFLDIGMPNMNGYDAARAMRHIPGLNRVRLIALTGWGAENDRQLSRDAGFDGHLTKPVHMSDIERVLEGAGLR